jgi:hypothetical protein
MASDGSLVAYVIRGFGLFRNNQGFSQLVLLVHP